MSRRAPDVWLNKEAGTITYTFFNPDDARETGIILQSAGSMPHGRIIDVGFYEDGRKLQQLADDWEGGRLG